MRAAMDGMVAGIPMAMFAMGTAMLRGRSAFRPVRLMAGTFEGERATRGEAATDLLGIGIHLTMSAIFGALFVPVLRFANFRGALPAPVVAVVYALGLWAFNESVTLPLVDPLMQRRMPKGIFAVSHVFYGLTLVTVFGYFEPETSDQLPLSERVELGLR
jgi:hypothetical protein